APAPRLLQMKSQPSIASHCSLCLIPSLLGRAGKLVSSCPPLAVSVGIQTKRWHDQVKGASRALPPRDEAARLAPEACRAAGRDVAPCMRELMAAKAPGSVAASRPCVGQLLD